MRFASVVLLAFAVVPGCVCNESKQENQSRPTMVGQPPPARKGPYRVSRPDSVEIRVDNVEPPGIYRAPDAQPAPAPLK